jgi:hypothetical protein
MFSLSNKLPYEELAIALQDAQMVQKVGSG